jgi:gentisate 1,2-dioxygenase
MSKKPEARQERAISADPWYEKLIEDMQGWKRQAEEGVLLIRGAEIPWHQNRQARVRYYLLPPYKADTALQTMAVFEQIIHRHSGMHRHQGGLAIYVLDGEGHTIVDGERYDWGAGDLLLLPIKPGGVAHQHFNRYPERPARWLAFIPMAFQEYLASEVVQIATSPDWDSLEGARTPREASQPQPAVIPRREVPAPPAGGRGEATLLDALFKLRDDHRVRAMTGSKVVRGKELPWESNRQGRMRWYLHPGKKDTALGNLIVYAQEIPPGGKSGRQRCPGGLVHYILDGRGAVEIDAKTYEWESGDCVALPLKRDGVEYQFFNRDAAAPARFVVATPNFFEVLGVDLGSAFEQLEDASP